MQRHNIKKKDIEQKIDTTENSADSRKIVVTSKIRINVFLLVVVAHVMQERANLKR